MNASYDGICVKFKRKNNTTGFPTFKLPVRTHLCWPAKYYFWQFWYMITRLWDSAELSIYSTHMGIIK